MLCITVFHAHTQHPAAWPLEAPSPGSVYDFQPINNLAAQSQCAIYAWISFFEQVCLMRNADHRRVWDMCFPHIEKTLLLSLPACQIFFHTRQEKPYIN